MLSKRIIGRLDIKNNFVIKGIQLEGLRKVGDPLEVAMKLYLSGIDELLYMDAVASLYGRNNLFDIIEKSCREIFVPITIGGGIRSLGDVQSALNSGADKVAINSAGIRNIEFLGEAVVKYGSQCIVGSIDCKKKQNGWEAYIENGREETGIKVLDWTEKLEQTGVGELLITSIDKDGTQKGMDKELLMAVGQKTNLPIIASGGIGSMIDVEEVLSIEGMDAVGMASTFHYNKFDVVSLKKNLISKGFSIRA